MVKITGPRSGAEYRSDSRAKKPRRCWLLGLLGLTALALGHEQPPPLTSFAAMDAAIRTQLRHYQEAASDWRPLPAGAPLTVGNRDPRVAHLRQLLSLYGDLQPASALPPGYLQLAGGQSRDPSIFDLQLKDAVAGFQRRHGLEATGIVDATTLRWLNFSPARRAAHLRHSLSLWRLAFNDDPYLLLVNVPEYRLHLIREGELVLSMKTVVGRSSSQTPELRTRLASIIFNPTWTVPRSLLVENLLPKARGNPQAMAARGYRAVLLRSRRTAPLTEENLDLAARGGASLQQGGGPHNSLGRFKFVLPNAGEIYLHDTLGHSLFGLRERHLSHGCVRLQEPRRLVSALLSSDGWSEASIDRQLQEDTTTILVRKGPVVALTYITSWIDQSGKAQFREDIYRRGPSDIAVVEK
ncbi:L,D-transpeptidase family protein [Biformimicrobium ophioploci]|uniref:L,D-TPase catalytic domain-containing protein n=1 Tax=Biformimicrobium ophioploci TaxID=3036711 RepID=A0ABQ6M0I1_9GAMM|nr:L,D-transpeptidase family protein [Microbulbifer sp. NKW57]GMG87853.1 hypothetical protein MNKW57_21740 [Microbulbifer sp. NKW57]